MGDCTKENILEKTLQITMISGIAFFTGMLVTFHKLDQRLWNENIVKGIDIETRFMNYPTKDCYDTSDLTRIIYGTR